MTFFGVGPRMGVPTMAYVAGALVAHWLVYPLFAMPFVSRAAGLGVGVGLIAVGVVVEVASVRTVWRAYHGHRLVTSGVYRLARHPIYAGYITLVLPGLAIALRCWLLLGAPVVMYILFRRVINREETWLESKFGEEYRQYKQRVKALGIV
jgi:protein-S-isoprenylcysteine O-methyltransferase Ste14